MRRNMFDMSPTAALGFLMQQAAHLETKVYEKKYPQYKYDRLVPLDASAPDWTDVVAFQTTDARGDLQLLGPNSTDVPTVDIAMGTGFHQIKTAALGYTYTLEEIGRAQLYGESLDARKATAVRDVTERGLNKIYLWGRLVGEGLYTSKNVTRELAKATLKDLVAAILDKGTQPIIDFFGHAYNQVYLTNTNTVFRPTDFVLPPEQMQLLMRTMLSTHNASNYTLLMFLQENFRDMTFTDDIMLSTDVKDDQGQQEETPLEEDRMVVYCKDMEVVKGHDTMPLQFLAPATADNVHFKVPAIMRTGGTEIRVPGALHYIDGV
ncbi:major capsid family protein [Enterobacter cloacae]|uniref:major capsid family protein n=1 Tax=Enterobacter cloacae TaxID=550 RepID=UPI0033614E43